MPCNGRVTQKTFRTGKKKSLPPRTGVVPMYRGVEGLIVLYLFRISNLFFYLFCSAKKMNPRRRQKKKAKIFGKKKAN